MPLLPAAVPRAARDLLCPDGHGGFRPSAAARTVGSIGDRLLRPRVIWLVLLVWAAAWALVMSRHGGVSWHYFRQGGLALADTDDATASIHVYATHPDLQFGPVALVLASLLASLGTQAGLVTAQVLGAVLGMVVLATVASTARTVAPLGTVRDAQRRLLVAGLAFLPVWMNLAVRFVHIDDVLALTLVVVAVRAAIHRHPVLAGVLLGLAAGAKPWALPFVVLALALRPPVRGRVLGVAAGVALAVWLPFVVSAPASLVVTKFVIPTSPASSLPQLGVHDSVTPWWDRPAQLALGTALAALAVRRGRWPAVVLLVVGVRIVLDPAAYSYYIAGILVGAVVWDLLGSRLRLPWWSVVASLGLFATRWLPVSATSQGWLRLTFVAMCVLALAAPPRRALAVGRRSVIQLRPAPLGPVAEPACQLRRRRRDSHGLRAQQSDQHEQRQPAGRPTAVLSAREQQPRHRVGSVGKLSGTSSPARPAR